MQTHEFEGARGPGTDDLQGPYFIRKFGEAVCAYHKDGTIYSQITNTNTGVCPRTAPVEGSHYLQSSYLLFPVLVISFVNGVHNLLHRKI